MKKMKLSVVVAVMCLLLISCGQAQQEKETTTVTTTESATTTELTTTAPIRHELLTVFADGKSDYSLLRSGEVDGVGQQLFLKFYQEMNERTGHSFRYTEDLIPYNTGIDPQAKEFLLGNTNRPESIALLEKLTAAGGNRFGISTSESKIAVTGTSPYQMYLGLDYFLEHFLTADENGNPSIVIESNFEYISEDSRDVQGFDVKELKESGRGMVFAVTERVIRISARNGYNVMQGAGTDGTYAYIGLINKSTTPEKALIYQYDLATMELVKVSEPLNTAHTNDITYDSKNDRLVVSYCSETDGWRGICFVDPNTLELIDYSIAPVANRGLQYLPSTNQYVVAAGYAIYLTDESFNPLSHFTCKDPQYTTQGLYCDEQYVYDVRYNGGMSTHYIMVHDMEGTYMASAKLIGVDGEPENIFMYNGEFYLGCNMSNSIYRLELIPENWW